MIALKLGVDLRTRAHQSGRDGCDVDIVLGEFRPHGIGKAHERKLAGRIRRHVRHGNFPADGRNVHNATAAFSPHLRHDQQIEDKRRPKMQAHRAIKIFELHMGKRTDLDGAGVVNQDVDLTEAPKRLLDCGLDLRGLEQVARDCQNVCSELIQVRFRALELFGVARDESHLASARANLARDFQSKATRAAGDESDFIAVRKASHLGTLTFSARKAMVDLTVFAVEARNFARGFAFDGALFQVGAFIASDFALADAELGFQLSILPVELQDN